MRSRLAEKLLVKTMEWSPEEISKQRPLLQALSNLKYDEYQQFSPGIRFIESLVKWLTQFEELEEKKTAYDFVINHLIFFSNDQISHLVNITYAAKIQPVIIKKVANEICESTFSVRKIVTDKNYTKFLRRSLFIGLSDGAKIDQLRRSYAPISNEQVLSSFEISNPKADDLISELKKSDILNEKFNTAFLVDDFTASGTSYFRKEENSWKGKIYKFINAIFGKDGIGKLRQEDETLDIHIIFYIATEESISKLNADLAAFKVENPDLNFQFSIEAIQILRSEIKRKLLNNLPLMSLIRKYYDDSINDSHYQKGKHDEPFLGFNECCLPLILNHNTPNNSLPILWFSEDKKFNGLFPRVTRHKDE